MDILPLGDSSLLIRVCERVGNMPQETIQQVLNVQRRIEAAKIPGIVDLAPAYTTIGVFYDPIQAVAKGASPEGIFSWLATRIHQALADEVRAVSLAASPVKSRRIEIPVCYGGEFGPDLEDVARIAGLTPEELIRRHSEGEYYVHCLGFTPGFPYLSGLAPELAMPRRDVPRKEIPAGSVGIGGSQTGIYPLRSPGGWHLIGRTPFRLFSVDGDPPSLLRPGDRVRFCAITPADFDAWRE